MKPNTPKDLQTIVDMATGADGGLAFCYFRKIMEDASEDPKRPEYAKFLNAVSDVAKVIRATSTIK